MWFKALLCLSTAPGMDAHFLQPAAMQNVKGFSTAEYVELKAILTVFLLYSPVPCWTWTRCPPRVHLHHQLPPRLGEVSLPPS